MDIAKITLWIPDQKSLTEILSKAKVKLDCGSPKTDTAGNFVITLFATESQARKVAVLGYKHELDEK